MTREEIVLNFLNEHDIPFTVYHHPEGKTIEEAKRWWKDDGSVHCKNLFFRNHKGNKHYLVCFHCERAALMRQTFVCLAGAHDALPRARAGQRFAVRAD